MSHNMPGAHVFFRVFLKFPRKHSFTSAASSPTPWPTAYINTREDPPGSFPHSQAPVASVHPVIISSCYHGLRCPFAQVLLLPPGSLWRLCELWFWTRYQSSYTDWDCKVMTLFGVCGGGAIAGVTWYMLAHKGEHLNLHQLHDRC